MDGSRTDGVMMQQDPQDRCSEEDVLTDKYKIVKTLGTGGFAEVKLALHRLTEVPVALKKLGKDKTDSDIIGVEVEILKFLDHPNIKNCSMSWKPLNISTWFWNMPLGVIWIVIWKKWTIYRKWRSGTYSHN